MLIYVFDKSEGKVFKKNRRRYSSIMFRVSNRSFVGDLPYRIIKQLIVETKFDATKSSSTLILVEAGAGQGYMGWKGFYVGKEIIKFKKFIESISYIDLNK
jgi:hypothetical protein